MEHRWSTRKSFKGNVILDSDRTGTVEATVRDVSLGGMLIDSGPITIPLHAPVIVGFNLTDDSGERHRLQAMIVRHGSKGTALMFLDPDVEIVRALRRVIYGERKNESDDGGHAPGIAVHG